MFSLNFKQARGGAVGKAGSPAGLSVSGHFLMSDLGQVTIT